MASELNKEFFNQEASSYEDKHQKTLQDIAIKIQSKLDFIGVDWAEDDGDEDDDDVDDKKASTPARPVRLLDYACGTGSVTTALAQYTTQCVGIDLSENMVAQYNQRAERQGLAADEMRAYQGNLCNPDGPSPAAFAGPEFFDFDLAAVCLGFHHFDDPPLAARRLAERLRPGGVLLIIDFLPHAKMDSAHAASHTVTHHGFSEEDTRRMFDEAGVGKDFALDEFSVVFNRRYDAENKLQKMSRHLFIARGTRA
ncbi:S-adenosyl-L-methionine-dependent methyltransferase [Bombardia bombarda]|uniref:S-adenosyl-L-methionine-dependent methyltransferase n=1 Tax=Bombardia bombarda TaxID=252184 RepID=A0AA39U4L8_9PEZI|nr:S-adenosyl-L-methionine-dependent methyltransferase [Bombardia bombarda]